MTVLYRFAGVGSSGFGCQTLWTMHPDSAEWLAQFESGGDVPASCLYQAEVIVDPVREIRVEPLIRAGRIDVNELRSYAKKQAPRGTRWVQFTKDGRSWGGAMLYRGDELVDAQPAR